MTKFLGRLADIGIAKEAVRGTAETSATFYLPKTSLTLDDGIEQAIDESSNGVIEDSVGAAVTGKFAEGEIEGNIYDKSFGLLLLACLGSVSTSGPSESTVYTHAFSVLQSAQHPALTLFLDDPNQDYKYPLAILESLNIDVMIGAYAKYTAAFRSKVGTTATLTPSYSTENHFLPQHGSLKIATNLAGLGAASAIDVRSVKLSFNKNIEDDRKLGSLDQADILNKQFSVEGSVELVFNDNTFKTDMLADTAKAMRLRLTNSDVTIGSSLNPQLTIDLAKAKFSKFERSYGNDDIVTATTDFKGFYSVADTEMVSAELINTQSSY
ncbi:phage tail tube protein [Parerythrobacter lacustris]|uniref:Phage tail tube protein n=1 Tax=Parerythrobacter lacustris TaxID=2969984 RepID=A0ABT1XSR5_9SPHN|nr:phage tail tube protein [Parerythrobacter lacustris]MCR2833477.1 phage tail tube protein [Parerythrobacter lacustris]